MSGRTHIRSNQSGQMLVLLLVFMAISLTLTIAAVAVTIANTQGAVKLTQGEDARSIAEAGLENAVQQVMRNQSYAGETLTVGSGTATITVSGTTTKTIQSVGTRGSAKRTMRATVTLSSNVWTVTSWSEI